MSLFMPALSKAKEETYRLVCKNNLKNIGQGLFVYSLDYSGWALGDNHNYFGFSSQYPWVYVLSRGSSEAMLGYLSWKYKAGTHPEGIFKCPTEKQFPMSGQPSVNYGMNFLLSVNSYYFRWQNNAHKGLFRITTVVKPFSLLYISDCNVNTYGVGPASGLEIHIPSRRHNGNTNVFFTDGHVESLTSSKLPCDPFNMSSFSLYPWTGR